MAKRNVDKMGYNSASVKDISRIFSCIVAVATVVVAVVVVVSAFSVRGVYIIWLQSVFEL